MKARKIMIILLIIVIIALAFSGRHSIYTIDDLAYVVSLGFDLSDNNKLKLSFQVAIPSEESSGGSSSSSGSSQSSSSIISTVECNSIESGINLINTYLSKKINLSHCKAIIFSEELCMTGIGEYLYTLINNIEIRPTCNVIITRCDAKHFLVNSKPMLEQLSSKYYDIASTSEKITGYTANISLQDFFSHLTDSFSESYAILGGVNNGSNTEAQGKDDSYKASETPISIQSNIETLGIAVFKGDKLVGELTGIESVAHLTLTNKLKNATISIPSPFESTNYIDLYVVKSKSTTKAYLSNGTPFIKPSVKIEARIISMSDDYKYLDDTNLELIKNYANLYVKSYMYNYLYKTSKEFKADIAGFGRYIVSNFATFDEWNKYNWLDNYQNSFFDLDVDVDIKSRYLLIDT